MHLQPLLWPRADAGDLMRHVGEDELTERPHEIDGELVVRAGCIAAWA
jgi:hypothetical protein